MSTPWQLQAQPACHVMPAPGKGLADDYADLVQQREDHIIAAVCDGVSASGEAGARAAEMVIASLKGTLVWPDEPTQTSVERVLREALQRSNKVILQDFQRKRPAPGRSPGTTTCTLGAVYVREGQCYASVAWVGDSPAELVGAGEVTPLTPRAEESAVSAPEALGSRETVTPRAVTRPVRPGQALLLHSDGVKLEADDYRRIYQNTIGGGHGWGKFLEQAMEAGRQRSDDDKSAVVIGVTGEPIAPPEPVYPPTPAAPTAPRRLSPAAALVLCGLVCGLLGVAVGRWTMWTRSRALRASEAGVRTVGARFAEQQNGTVVLLSGLFGEQTKEAPQSWGVFSMARGTTGLDAKPAGVLQYWPETAKREVALSLSLPPGEYHTYLDGKRVTAAPVLAQGRVGSHKLAVFGNGEPKSWACWVTERGGRIVLRPLAAGTEPRP